MASSISTEPCALNFTPLATTFTSACVSRPASVHTAARAFSLQPRSVTSIASDFARACGSTIARTSCTSDTRLTEEGEALHFPASERISSNASPIIERPKPHALRTVRADSATRARSSASERFGASCSSSSMVVAIPTNGVRMS